METLRVLRGAYRRIPNPDTTPAESDPPTVYPAGVESFTTYYATCPLCGWEGPGRESDQTAAEVDADAHQCTEQGA